MKLELYCTCGAVRKIAPNRRKAQQARIVWANEHQGPGHAPCTAAIAEQARVGFGQPGGREFERQERVKHE